MSWRVTGVNIDTVDHLLSARAVCMTVDARAHAPEEFAIPTFTPAPPPIPAKLSVSVPQTTAFCGNGRYPPLKVQNIGGGTLNWSATASDSGITLTPASGSLGPGEIQTVTAQGSAPGSTQSIVFTSNGGSSTVTFTCT